MQVLRLSKARILVPNLKFFSRTCDEQPFLEGAHAVYLRSVRVDDRPDFFIAVDGHGLFLS